MEWTLNGFLGTCCDACVKAGEKDRQVNSLLFTEDGEEVVVAAMVMGAPPQVFRDAVAALFAGHHCYGAMATRINFSPTPDGESSLSWVITGVAPDENPAVMVAVKRDVDQLWAKLAYPDDVPWFIISTADAVTAAVKGDLSAMVPKEIPKGDRSMLNKPLPGQVDQFEAFKKDWDRKARRQRARQGPLYRSRRP